MSTESTPHKNKLDESRERRRAQQTEKKSRTRSFDSKESGQCYLEISMILDITPQWARCHVESLMCLLEGTQEECFNRTSGEAVRDLDHTWRLWSHDHISVSAFEMRDGFARHVEELWWMNFCRPETYSRS